MQSRIAQLLVATGFALGIPMSSQAATFTPNVFDDPAPVAAPNGCTNQGSNPTRCSLREAVLSANANNETDTIALSEGTYNLTIPEAGGPESGDLDFVEGDGAYDIKVQGASPNRSVINAAPGLNERAMDFTGASAVINLSNLIVQNGNSPGSGGGVSFTIGSLDLTLDHCDFNDNDAAQLGGGAYVSAGSGPFNALNSNFSRNTALRGGGLYFDIGDPTINIDGGLYSENESATSGGGLYLSGIGEANELYSVQNIVVIGNKALDGDGGGIFHSTLSGLRLNHVQVLDNTVENFDDSSLDGNGGGVYSSNGGDPIVAEIVDSVIRGNSASGNSVDVNQGGGGLFTGGSGATRIIDTTIADNRALNDAIGGGLLATSGGPDSGLQMVGCTVSGNSASTGGGVYHSNGGNGVLREITNSTISGNSSNTAGGGLYIDRFDPGFSLNNVTVVDNSAGTVAGGVYSVSDPIVIRNSLFGQNSSGDNQSDDCSGTASAYDSDGYNIFGSLNNADCQPDNGGNPTDQFGVDPKIAPLADNGGPNFTHNLLAGSPAIDGGNPNGCVDGNGAPLTTDQRGFVRPSGPECDIGAVEAAVTDLAIVKTADDETYFVGDQITYTLSVTNSGDGISPAVVSDALPSGVILVSIDASCSEGGGTITCDLGSLDPGESAAVNIVVEANSDGTVENTATVSGADIDTDPANNSSTVTINVLSDDSGGGCSLGNSPLAGPRLGWGILGIVLLAAFSLRRRAA